MTALTVMVVILFVMVLGLSIAVIALSRQVGILFERVAPMGALIIDAGPKIGAAAPILEVPTLNGGKFVLGGAAEAQHAVVFLVAHLSGVQEVAAGVALDAPGRSAMVGCRPG